MGKSLNELRERTIEQRLGRTASVAVRSGPTGTSIVAKTPRGGGGGSKAYWA